MQEQNERISTMIAAGVAPRDAVAAVDATDAINAAREAVRQRELDALAAADAEGTTTARHERRGLIAEGVPREGEKGLWAREYCRRCGGSGHYSFNLMHGTVCFGCAGRKRGKLVRVDAAEILKLEKAADRRAVKRDEAAAERRARWDAEAAAGRAEVERDFPEAYAILDGYDGRNKFIADVASRMAQYGRLKRDGDMSNIARAVVDAHARDNGFAVDVPTGRVVVEGEVIKTDVKFNAYGERHVMTVKNDEGWAVWGSIPRDISAVERGDRVRFTATVEASEKPTFGFFKRPSNAEVTREAPRAELCVECELHPVSDSDDGAGRCDECERDRDHQRAALEFTDPF
jgi:hypothetical protein